MPNDLHPSAMLLDPRSRRPLSIGTDGRLYAERVPVSTFAGIPYLLSDQTLANAWRSQALTFRATAHANADAMARAAARHATMLPLTYERLNRSAEATRSTADLILQLFEIESTVPLIPAEADMAARIMEGFASLMRDWRGDDSAERENGEALAQIVHVLHSGLNIKRLLSLGAGGARLTLDVHRHVGAKLTVAMDTNPLPLIVANRLLRGESLILHEFLMNPVSPAAAAAERTLALRGPRPEDLILAFADPLHPPVVPGAFDAVLTPWYLERAGADLPAFITELARILPREGHWINLGSLVWGAGVPIELRWTYAELCEAVERGGFVIEAQHEERRAFLYSPENANVRVESVHAFVARRL